MSLDRRKLVRAALVTGAFALLGPLIGTMLLFMPIFGKATLAALGALTSDRASIEALSKTAALFAMFGYLIGGLSALLAGLALGYRTYRKGELGYGETLVASAVSALVGSTVVLAVPDREPGAVGGLLLFLVPLGIISGLVCRFLLARLRVLSPRTNHATSPAERN